MRLYISALLIFVSVGLFAQNRVGIEEVLMSTAKGDQPAFEFFVPDTESKEVLSAWNSFHKNFKAKPKQDKTQRNYYFTDNALILELSENTIDIYARIYETNGGVKFTCAFDLGGVFISSDKTAEKFNKTKLLLNKFYAQMAMDAIVKEIEKELAELEKYKEEYEAIEKEIDDFENQSKEYAKNIEEQKQEELQITSTISEKEQELIAKKSDLKEKQDELKEIDKAGMVASLTSLENNLKKTDLEAVRIEKDIERKEAEIATIQADINILKNDLVVRNDAKVDLQSKIDAIVDKLESLDIDKKEEKVKLLEQNISEISKTQSDLNFKKNSVQKTITAQTSKLQKAKEAINIAQQTKELLEKNIASQQTKLKELEELKATIE